MGAIDMYIYNSSFTFYLIKSNKSHDNSCPVYRPGLYFLRRLHTWIILFFTFMRFQKIYSRKHHHHHHHTSLFFYPIYMLLINICEIFQK